VASLPCLPRLCGLEVVLHASYLNDNLSVRNRPNVTHCSTTLVDPDCNINPTLLSQTATLRQLVSVVVLLSGGNATLLVCACSAVKTNHW